LTWIHFFHSSHHVVNTLITFLKYTYCHYIWDGTVRACTTYKKKGKVVSVRN
jgi:hypothetical protein